MIDDATARKILAAGALMIEKIASIAYFMVSLTAIEKVPDIFLRSKLASVAN